MSRSPNLTPAEVKILDRLRDGPCASDELQRAAGLSSRKSLHVMVHYINAKGFTITCEKRWPAGRVGCDTGVYTLVNDPAPPPFHREYAAMARSMGVGA